jgi:hypothetical protein
MNSSNTIKAGGSGTRSFSTSMACLQTELDSASSIVLGIEMLESREYKNLGED